MNIKIGDLITLDDGKYITIGEEKYNDEKYIFTNKLTEDEKVTQEFIVFKEIDDELEIIEDQKILDILYPKFIKNIQDIVED